MKNLRAENHGSTRVLTINRPAKRNALTTEVVFELTREISSISSEITSIVLTAEGNHFSAGGDAETVLSAIEERETLAMMKDFHGLIHAIRESRVPVICVVFGAVYGGGFNLALACDVVVAAEGTRFCEVFLRRGVVPDLGGAYLLSRSIGYHRAMELILSTREIDAIEAQELGIVATVTTNRQTAVEEGISFAGRLADFSSEALEATVRLLRSSRDLSFEAALELEAQVQSRILYSDGAREGFSSISSRRTSNS